EIDGEHWYVQARDGARPRVAREQPDGDVDATLRLSLDTYARLVAAQITPAEAMRNDLIEVKGRLYPVTLVGRWIDRAQGRAVPARGAEWRGRDLPRHAAGGRGAPRRVLRPLRRRGDGARLGRSPWPDAGAAAEDDPAVVRRVRRRPARHRRPRQGEAGRPRP